MISGLLEGCQSTGKVPFHSSFRKAVAEVWHQESPCFTRLHSSSMRIPKAIFTKFDAFIVDALNV